MGQHINELVSRAKQTAMAKTENSMSSKTPQHQSQGRGLMQDGRKKCNGKPTLSIIQPHH